jgi:hypothetical protein
MREVRYVIGVAGVAAVIFCEYASTLVEAHEGGAGILRPRTHYHQRGNREPNRWSRDDLPGVAVTGPPVGGFGSASDA